MSYSWGAGRSATRVDGYAVRSALDVAPRPTSGQSRDLLTAPTATSTEVTSPSPTASPWAEQQRVAAELAPMVEVWQRLLAKHVPDRAGRCRTCTKGGTGLPSTPWPCSIHGIAELARRWHDEDPR